MDKRDPQCNISCPQFRRLLSLEIFYLTRKSFNSVTHHLLVRQRTAVRFKFLVKHDRSLS